MAVQRHLHTSSRASAAAHRRAVRRQVTTTQRAPTPASSLRGLVTGHRCPACGGANVRRSGVRQSEAGAHAFRSPYRCADCQYRFWVISRKARLGMVAAVAGAVAAVAAVAFILIFVDYAKKYAVVDHEIEEWSAPAPSEWSVLSPRGMAAAVLVPNEVLVRGTAPERVARPRRTPSSAASVSPSSTTI